MIIKDKILLSIANKLKHVIIPETAELEFIEIKIKTKHTQINVNIEKDEI